VAGMTTINRQFVRHYLEMLVAMVVGMVALGPLWTLALGSSGPLDRPELNALVMATNMTVAMSAWMRFRSHSWRATAEMAAAMYVPFLVLFPPLWLGVIDSRTMVVAGHVLMLPAMAGVMLLRPHEYLHHHGDGAHG
jgi:hypothetical protein